MAKIETLNELSHLKWTRFGCPKPRHGLKLLFWFANDCISFNYKKDIIAKCDPESREFGFHPFENRYDRNGAKLLPDVEFEYYEVGNLNSARAYELPDYVREDFTGHPDGSNMDRIIVSVDNEWFDKVYVTEHDGRTNFNPQATFFISRGLLMIIRNLELNDFLKQTGYWKHSEPAIQCPVITYDYSDSKTRVPKPNTVMVCASTVTPNNQDCRINIDSGYPIQTDYSSPRRKTCCECTIL